MYTVSPTILVLNTIRNGTKDITYVPTTEMTFPDDL